MGQTWLRGLEPAPDKMAVERWEMRNHFLSLGMVVAGFKSLPVPMRITAGEVDFPVKNGPLDDIAREVGIRGCIPKLP